MANNSFDLSIAFDSIPYLNPQIHMFVATLKNNLPKNTILHVTTDRNEDDECIQFIKSNIKNVEIYIKPTYDDLKSRCKYREDT